MSQALNRCRIALNAIPRQSKSLPSRPRPLCLAHALRCHEKRTYSTARPPVESNHSRPTLRSGPSGSSNLATYLDNLFSPLQFPPELAARILTHASHRDALVSHNTRLSFIGRRVLNTYLLLFLHSAPSLQAEHDYELIIDRALNTYVLGEHVAPKWSLGNVMKWAPVNIDPKVNPSEADYSNLEPSLSRSVGLYKVQGMAVEAVVGGIFHQFGGSIAHQIFHTRVLPHILIPGRPEGLHDAFHEHAMAICEDMGGVDGAIRMPEQPTATSNFSAKREEQPAESTLSS